MSVIVLGHSTRKVEELIQILRQYRIEVLVDVRSHPYSRVAPQFNREALSSVLSQAGVRYVWLGHELGGLPGDPALYNQAGEPDYGRMRLQPAFQLGIARLVKAHRQGRRVAVMCTEASSVRCHRRLLIGRELEGRGVNVLYLDDPPQTRGGPDRPWLESVPDSSLPSGSGPTSGPSPDPVGQSQMDWLAGQLRAKGYEPAQYLKEGGLKLFWAIVGPPTLAQRQFHPETVRNLRVVIKTADGQVRLIGGSLVRQANGELAWRDWSPEFAHRVGAVPLEQAPARAKKLVHFLAVKLPDELLARRFPKWEVDPQGFQARVKAEALRSS